MDISHSVLMATARELAMDPVSVKEVAWGFLSRAFVVTCEQSGREFSAFVRMKKNQAPGSYEDVDQRDSFHRSHLWATNAEGHPKSLFVTEIPSESGVPVILHAQEFRPPTDSLDYSAIVTADALSEADESKIRQVARKIGELHLLEVPPSDATDDAYDRSVLEIVINPELTYPTLAHFPENHPIFGHCERKYRYLADMARAADVQMAKKSDRSVRRLHGDFWSSNVLFDAEGCYFVDFSRVPVGEAGIDIGWFLGNLAIDAALTGNGGARQAFEVFHDEYVRTTGDVRILENSVLPLFWIAVIRIFPPVYGDSDDFAKAEKILDFVLSRAENGVLSLD